MCSNDAYEHRTGDRLLIYCPTCGAEGTIKRVEKRERWTKERRKAAKENK